MTALVSMEMAKRHLRLAEEVTGESGDVGEELDLAAKVLQASEIVLNYVTHEDKDVWTEEDVPGTVQASVLLVLSDLWEHRAGSDTDDVFLSAAVKSLLRRYRDPAMA